MCPLVNELKKQGEIETLVCVTGQHKEMVSPVLELFGVKPDYDLEIMKVNQTITTSILDKIKPVLENERPDIVLVHGDTTTTYAAALAAFYLGIKVGHVEAGLRTYNLQSPFPEEFNRQSTSIIANCHFAPTELARENLEKEGRDNVYVTGNTVIDALKTTVREDYSHPVLDWVAGSRLILLTAHRRENLGEPMKHMFRAVKRVLNLSLIHI